MKEEKMFPITERQWIKIFKVACRDWKDKIANYIDSDVKELSYEEVKEMFSAATPDQKVVLIDVFSNFKVSENAFCGTFPSDKVKSISREIFKDNYAFQITKSAYPEGRQDLIGRAFYVSEKYKVVLHNNWSGIGSTTIEIIKK